MKQVMEQIEVLLNPYMIYIILGLAVLVFLLLVVICINTIKMNKLKKRFEKFMSKDNLNLEELLAQYTQQLNTFAKQDEETQASITYMKKVVKDCVQKVGVVRYQAIQNMGADLSYTVALLNENNDGVVFNGIYGRDGCYTYAKPIIEGKSSYNLSEEEEQAIEQAIKKASM